MKTLPQYHFDRDDFTKVFQQVFKDHVIDVEVACQEHKSTDSFLLYYKEDDFYILHFESGVLINWYKHIGRCNTCSDESFLLSDLRIMLEELKEELGYGR